MRFSAGWGCAEMLGIGSGEGGITAEAGLKTTIGSRTALPNQIAGMKQAAFLQVIMDGATGFLLE